jgi:protoporphyrinogen oxidase
MNASRVLVIGGGFAGVAAAAALRSRGAAVTLLEQRPVLGGRARSDELAELTVDTGAQLIATSFVRTVRLLAPQSTFDETSSGETSPMAPGFAAHDDRLQRTRGRDLYVRDGVRYPIQYGSIRSLLTFGGLGALEKLKLGRHLLPLIALHRAQLDADATRLPASLDGESASDFVTARVGPRAVDVLVEPPLNGFYGVRGNEASLGFFLILGRYGSESDVLAAPRSRAARASSRSSAQRAEGSSRAVTTGESGRPTVRWWPPGHAAHRRCSRPCCLRERRC